MSPSAIWRRFVDAAGDYDVEGPLDDVTAPIATYFPGGPARQFVFITKDALARQNELFPPATVVFVLHGPATAQHCRFLRWIVDQTPVLFLGDLDPMDLTTFGTLRAGGTNWENDPAAQINVQYRGINDHVLDRVQERWTEHIARTARPRRRARSGPGQLIIRMQPVERRHFRVLCRLMPDLQDLVGSRAFDLMRRGWKLEVEALSFDRAFLGEVLHRVLDPDGQSPDATRPMAPQSEGTHVR